MSVSVQIYSNDDLKTALGLATLENAGMRGVGLLHNPLHPPNAFLAATRA